MSKDYKLKESVGSSSQVNLDDVWVLKKALRQEGLYVEPAHGMTPYPDEALFTAIKSYQSRNGLRVDGVVAPGGETEEEMQPLLLSVATMRCVVCKAWHGGLHSPRICADCWGKGYR